LVLYQYGTVGFLWTGGVATLYRNACAYTTFEQKEKIL